MKLKRTFILLTVVAAMGLLLGVSAAQATVIFDPSNPTQATGIEDLDIGGTPYNVAFTATETVAEKIYGPFPGTFDFANSAAANEAANAVNLELNQAGENTGTFVQKLHCDTREKFVVTMNLLMHVLHDVPLYLAADPPGRTPTKVEKKSPGGE